MKEGPRNEAHREGAGESGNADDFDGPYPVKLL